AEAAERSANAAERSAVAVETTASEDQDRRRREAEASRVRLMRGLLAEIKENVELAEPEGVPFVLPFVRDMWAAAKDRVGDLPEEVVDSVQAAYSLAEKSNRLVEWQVELGGRGAYYADPVAKAASDAAEGAKDSFRDAAPILEHWIRMKEKPGDVEEREGPAL
ncbi:MAG: hypothetical protein ACRD1T_01205, partial [Acidimicrobiia bacterium]